MKTNFEDYLLGLYDNIQQAQSYPTEFAQVYILWEKIDDGYHSKQWYRRDGASKPYRERNYKITEISDIEVILENYNLDWTRCETCDMIFKYDGQTWHGKLLGNDCIVRENVRVVSEVRLTQTGLESRDQGYDPDGKMVFGSLGIYNFKRGRLTQR
jgi:hypothetical protein